MRGIKVAITAGWVSYTLVLLINIVVGWEWGFFAAIGTGVVVFALVLLVTNTLEHLDHVPPRDRRPRPEFPEPPEPTEPTYDRGRGALEVVRLSFIIRGEDGDRIGMQAKENDLGIRPIIELQLRDQAFVGKQARIKFLIQGPRRRTRYDWTAEVPFTLSEGLLKVWPRAEEFPIAGQEHDIGSWQLEVQLVAGDGYSSLLQAATFTIRREHERAVRVGADASISEREREEIAADRGTQTVDDVLENW